jgi:(4-alkanoyl-5-oxo-2,5-dihydrofuran-3-yl)methyl phosphate reductase
MNILVTGATGHVGALVVERLLARGMHPRIFVRDAAKARDIFRPHLDTLTDVATGDFSDATSLARAFAGIDAAFLVTSGPDIERLDASAARAARAAGVRRLVKLSSYDAEHQVGTGVWHARGEAAIRASGVGFAFVRPTGFMVNALHWTHAIRQAGVVRSCTGDGRIPFVHSDDIADVAVAALLEPAHDGATLPITGPVAMSYPEMTAELARALERPLRYELIADDVVRQQMHARGESAAEIDAHLSIYRAIREGRLAEVTDTVARIVARPPRTFARWVREHVAAFR